MNEEDTVLTIYMTNAFHGVWTKKIIKLRKVKINIGITGQKSKNSYDGDNNELHWRKNSWAGWTEQLQIDFV